MVNGPTDGHPAGAAPGSTPPSDAKPAAPRDRIVQALMTLAAGRPWDEITITDIAREAGVSLAEFRDHFPSKGAILGGFARMIDRKVLEGSTAELADEPAKERVFDVLMRRIDALTPYKSALRHIAAAMRRDPASLFAMNGVSLNSQRFMLAAAGIDTEGPLGSLKLQGAVIAFSRTLDTWFDDDDPGLAKTLARLDRELTRGERFLVRAEDVHRLTAPFRAVARAFCAGPDEMRRRFRERGGDARRYNDEDYSPASTI